MIHTLGKFAHMRAKYFFSLTIPFFFLVLPLCLLGFPAPAQTENDTLMLDRAEDFIRSLSPGQKDSVMLPFNSPQKTAWSNNSYNIVKRAGIYLGELSDTQRVLLQDLIRSGLSPQGYLKIMNTIRLDDYLHIYGASLNDPYWAYYGHAFYWIVFFGTPSKNGNWGWKFEGHHLSLNFFFRNGKLSGTPLFLGAHPNLIRAGDYAGFRYLQDETDEAYGLMASLDPDQLKQAVISPSLPVGDDIRARIGNEPFLQQSAGIPFPLLHPGQQTIFHRILADYIDNLTPAFAKSIWQQWPGGNLDSFHFIWMGPINNRDSGYYALQSGGFIIEFIIKEPLHIHTLMRDIPEDFGGSLNH